MRDETYTGFKVAASILTRSPPSLSFFVTGHSSWRTRESTGLPLRTVTRARWTSGIAVMAEDNKEVAFSELGICESFREESTWGYLKLNAWS